MGSQCGRSATLLTTVCGIPARQGSKDDDDRATDGEAARVIPSRSRRGSIRGGGLVWLQSASTSRGCPRSGAAVKTCPRASVALVAIGSQLATTVRAQDPFEIQIYEYLTVPKGRWNL